MNSKIDRRHFIQASGIIMAGTAAPVLFGSTSSPAPAGRIKKAIGWDMIEGKLSAEDKFRLAKEVGFKGVEISRHASKQEEAEPKVLARASEKAGMPIHGVSNG